MSSIQEEDGRPLLLSHEGEIGEEESMDEEVKYPLSLNRDAEGVVVSSEGFEAFSFVPSALEQCTAPKKKNRECCPTGKTPQGSTSFQTGLAIAKCVVGSGSFYLPSAFAAGGFALSIISLTLLGALTTYTNNLAIKLKNIHFPTRPSSYFDVARKGLGRLFGVLEYVSIIIVAVGTMSTYLVFSGKLMHSVDERIQLYQVVLVFAAIQCLFSWLKDFRFLVILALIGDVALLFCVIVVIVFGVKTGIQYPPSQLPMFDWAGFGSFFGGVVFLFAIPSLLFPIHNAMKRPQKFTPVLIVTFVLVTALNVFFGAICLLFWGPNVEAIVINSINVPGSAVWVKVAQVALAVDLFGTFVPVFLPMRDIVEKSFLGSLDVNHGYWKRIIIRAVLIMATAGVAIGIPNISALINLMSGVGVSFNAFILAPLLWIVHCFAAGGRRGLVFWVSVALHIVIMLFGAAAGGLTTYQGVVTVIDIYSTNATAA